jgi:glutamine amidotransferase
MIGGFDTQLAYEFFQGFVNHALVTLHIDNLQGRQRAPPVRDGVQGLRPRAAHGADARPAFGRAIPSTKGTLYMGTVAVVDYGMGNLRSVSQAVLHVAAGSGVDVVVTSPPRGGARRRARGAARPGRDARLHARAARLRPEGRGAGRRRSKPLMGVCVGMQMLLDHSEEQDTPGLGLIPARCVRFRLEGRRSPTAAASRCRRWAGTACTSTRPHPIWAGVPDGAWFYFVHSYYARPARSAATPPPKPTTARALPARVARDNIFATQFHPEKSAEHGLALYRNFLSWKP